MNRSQAGDLISQTFTHAFEKGQFRNFALNLLNHVDETKAFARNSQYIKDAFKDHVSRFERLGTYTSPDKQKLDLLIVHLTKESKLERARTAIRNFVADHLKDRDGKDAALVAFVSPSESTWRFSYVKMEYATVEKDSGEVGVERLLTPARRFSYIVGEGESCHTAQARFIELLQDTGTDPTLARIEEAFSVEAVTKEFFTKYAELFKEIHGALDRLVAKDKPVRDDFTANAVNTVDFAKKLMGQIVFLYFLQKKGWLGVARGAEWGSGPHDFLRRLWKGEYCRYDNFFNDVLEPLFFDTLATDRGHDAWSGTFKCRIPFLNGGLFEPTGGYNWRKTKILLPNRLFANSEHVEGDISGTGVLDMFDRYNFTVNEAEPLEKEVAIDPEMLGKVFENLIEENRRKGLGAYYTPREIVHYMCQKSLISYLGTTVNGDKELIPRTDIETFIHLGEQAAPYEAARVSGTKSYRPRLPKNIEQYARLIDEKLADVTICDPAVGSGAFPVGMMTEIVRARAALTPYFNEVQDRTPYYFKRHAIQNCLYGVDIDPGAVEIAKLRLWLSLVVDEEEVARIKPLPNLDYKIMQGNSLLEEYEGVRLFDERFIIPATVDARPTLNHRISELQKEALRLHSAGEWTPEKKKEIEEETKRLNATLKKMNSPAKDAGPMLFAEMERAAKKAEELRNLHAGFFEESQHAEKERLKTQIEQLEWELIEATLREEGNESALKKLAQFKKTNIKPFFLWKLNFSEVFRGKGGFDIVIANPPYVDSENMVRSDPRGRELLSQLYATAKGNWDLFVVMIERGVKLLSSTGRISYIVPNKMIAAPYAETLREFLQSHIVREIRDYSAVHVFDNVAVYPIVFLVQKTGDREEDVSMSVMNSLETTSCINRIPSAMFYSDTNWDRYFERPEILKIVIKCGQHPRLGQLLPGISAAATVAEAYDLTKYVREHKAHEARPFKKLINTGTIDRYASLWSLYPTRYIKHSYKAPIVGDADIKELNPRRLEQARSKKIIIGGMNRVLECVYDEGDCLAGKSTVVVLDDDAVDLKYVLGILNSRVVSFWFRAFYRSLCLAGGYLRISAKEIRNVPAPRANGPNAARISSLVEKVLAAKKRDHEADTTDLERDIDQLVYKLYELTPEEVAVVEKSGASPVTTTRNRR
jgi:type I restriction-modification system DNA methylase subunit